VSGNAGELETGRARAFCFPHLLKAFKKLFNQAQTMTGSLDYDSGAGFSRCPLPKQHVTI
jgi:hypothetical protein